MVSRSSKRSDNPFKELGRLLEQKNLKLPNAPAPAPDRDTPMTPKQEEKLFKTAMADVAPLRSDLYWQFPSHPIQFESAQDEEEKEALAALRRLIDSGDGFIVSDTAEYMEVIGPGFTAEVARRLHNGHYSVQSHIDLHGFSVEAAKQAFHDFIRAAIKDGKKTVLVVHGRGLTSPGQPVLKNMIFKWLTRGPIRKNIVAFTSARSCDGGAGATYILLRRQPISKQMRKSSR